MAAQDILNLNPHIKLIITAGGAGSYIYETNTVYHIPCIKENVISTAGAGDAFIGGTISSLIQGNSFINAAKYGAVIARFAVLSKNTIAEDVTLENVEEYMRKS